MHSPSQSNDLRSEKGDNSMPDLEDVFEMYLFDQVMDMDEGDPEREFSRTIFRDFYKQAYKTIGTMQTCLKETQKCLSLQRGAEQPSPEVLERKLSDELDRISREGHFLKGSSATLGMVKVKDSCEKIQHFGARRDETGSFNVSSEEAVTNLEVVIPLVEAEFKEAQELVCRFHGIPVLNLAQIEKEEDEEAAKAKALAQAQGRQNPN